MVTYLRVKGMSCENCARHVGFALKSVAGVEKVAIDLVGGSATVTHLDGVELQALVDAVAEEGYEATRAG